MQIVWLRAILCFVLLLITNAPTPQYRSGPTHGALQVTLLYPASRLHRHHGGIPIDSESESAGGWYESNLSCPQTVFWGFFLPPLATSTTGGLILLHGPLLWVRQRSRTMFIVSQSILFGYCNRGSIYPMTRCSFLCAGLRMCWKWGKLRCKQAQTQTQSYSDAWLSPCICHAYCPVAISTDML